MPCVKLYGTGSATANAVANVQIPNASRIRGIQASVYADCITDNGFLKVEVSRASAREIAVNGAQQALVEVNVATNFVTSGLSQFGVNQFFPIDVPVVQGQLIYLHAAVSGTVTYDATFILWY